MQSSLGKPKTKDIKVLLDSGASSSLIKDTKVSKLRIKDDTNIQWHTSAGVFATNQKVKVNFLIPDLHEKRLINHEFHVAKDLGRYDMIIGRDLLSALQINIQFSDNSIHWDTSYCPMKPIECTIEESYHINESSSVQEATDRMQRILDAKYEPADLDAIIKSYNHLNIDKQRKLYDLLHKYKGLFDGTLGKWRDEKYKIDLKESATPYHARAYPVPRAYENTLRLEVDRLCKAGVLRKINRSEWAAPTFVIPKKDGTVRFISDFRELNKRIKRKPYPLPKIQDLLLKLEGFRYGTALDLNMGYYHIELNPDSRRLCTIVLPWGKYEYQRLPMGLCNSPDIFQEKMGSLMEDLEYVRCYIDDLLVITKGSFLDHLKKLDEVLKRLEAAGLKVNITKSSFAESELEYLGYWITREGVQPLAKKIEAIQKIARPKTKKELRRFIGMINYYRDMWPRRSETLGPLTKLCSQSKNVKFKWTEEHDRAFNNMKRLLSKHSLLVYPDFNKPFEIHTDASKNQLGAVISQNGKPIAFYSRKLSNAQTRYTTTERELLAIVETLKEFRNILLGQEITVWTDHKNLTCANFNTERVMRWRLLLEEYGPTLQYIKGPKNIIADALSRLDMGADTEMSNELTSLQQETTAELFANTEVDLPEKALPVQLKLIEREQQKDEIITNSLSKLTIKDYTVADQTVQLATADNKIVVPNTLQRRIVEWYHVHLCHPGETRTEGTIRQHFTWKGLRTCVHDVCTKCKTCQTTKKGTAQYGLLPEKQAEAIPWQRLNVDLVGPYRMHKLPKSEKERAQQYKLWCITMMDPATSWMEIVQITDSKEPEDIANLVEQTWLSRYPWPEIITYDKGTEFLRGFADMVTNDYGIKVKGSTKRNPQSNAIIERAHQTIGNIIRTFEVHKDDDACREAFEGVLSATMFAMRSTYHTTLDATPAQLVFGRDAIMNVKFQADWNYIKDRKQKVIKQNNRKENRKRIAHTYAVGDKVLYKAREESKYAKNPYEGPYTVLQVNNNGTLLIQTKKYQENINIRLLKPFKE